MKSKVGSKQHESADTTYLDSFNAWRAWANESIADTNEAASCSAAHAAVLTAWLGATDTTDLVRGAQAATQLTPIEHEHVANIGPAQSNGPLLALRVLMDYGWRPFLRSSHQMLLANDEQVHAFVPCTAFYWGKRQVTTLTAGGLNPFGLILALITIPIAIARQAEARQDKWRPLGNSKGKLVVTERRLLRIGADNKVSSIPYAGLQSFELNESQGGLEIELNNIRLLYRLSRPQLIHELLRVVATGGNSQMSGTLTKGARV